jgi:hypothetical protein
MADANEQTKTNDKAADAGKPPRHWLPTALVVLASLIGVVAVFAIWAQRQLLETDSWVDTSTELLENEDVRDAVALYLVDELYANVNVEREIRQQLPLQFKVLANPAAGALRQVADQIAERALETPPVQTAWEDANRTAHELFIEAIEGGGDKLSTAGGVVTLDLGAILGQVADQIGLPGDLASKLPPDIAQLEILRSDELEAAQDGADLLKTLAWVLTALTLGLYALAVYLARGRRREALRSVGFGFGAAGLIVLFLHGVAGNAVVGSLTTTASTQPAAQAVWDIGTSLLTTTAGAMIIYGIAIVLAAWLAGPTRPATAVRRALAPYLRQPRIAYAGLAVILVLLFWWSPTAGFERLVPSLILIGLLVLGTEMLRRETEVEFPDRVTTFSAAGMAQTMAGQTRDSIARRVRSRGDQKDADAATSRVDALERLGNLRDSGVLTEQQFEAEKQRLLGSSAEQGTGSPDTESADTESAESGSADTGSAESGQQGTEQQDTDPGSK